VRAAFSEVRQKLLPDIVGTRYAEAKSAFDKKDFAAAAPLFRRVIALLDDPDMAGRQADLRTLAQGFLDLSLAASAPPPAPSQPEPAADPAPPPAPKPDPRRVYSADDTAVTAPAVIRQEMPRLPQNIVQQARDHGVVEITIDEQGRVTSAAMRESVHPIYDNLVLNAARQWRYQPATFAGMPVKFRKLIQINISRLD
jgi:TonB family protein